MSPAAIASKLRRGVDNFSKIAAQALGVRRAADMLVAALRRVGKVMFCGKGGSAADAQYLAAELVGRYIKDRRLFAALALTVDTRALTAMANDYSFGDVFARQLRGIRRKGDAFVGMSTNGNGENVARALAAARERGIATIELTGSNGGKMTAACDLCIHFALDRTDHIQKMHIAIRHILCGIVEEVLC